VIGDIPSSQPQFDPEMTGGERSEIVFLEVGKSLVVDGIANDP